MTTKHQFQLKSGREIQLITIYQWSTYSGLLEGLPTQEMNQRIIKGAVAKSREWWSMKPYLVAPTETLINLVNDYPFGTPARLPGITCLGRFECKDPVHDRDMAYSELAVVWFQPEFAFPIEELIETELHRMEWDAHAIDRDY
jgi:hypothetical protein